MSHYIKSYHIISHYITLLLMLLFEQEFYIAPLKGNLLHHITSFYITLSYYITLHHSISHCIILYHIISHYVTLPTFVALPLPLGAHATFVRLSRASFISHLLAPPPCRAGPFPWLALWYGMVSHWLSGHFQEYSL